MIMSPRPITLLAVVVMCVGSCLAQSAQDKEHASKLVGTWVVPPKQSLKSAKVTFRADGTFKGFVVLSIGGRDVTVRDEGKWKIENSMLITEITKCDQPEMFPVGTVTRDTIVSVTDTQYRVRTKDGVEEYRTRGRE